MCSRTTMIMHPNPDWLGQRNKSKGDSLWRQKRACSGTNRAEGDYVMRCDILILAESNRGDIAEREKRKGFEFLLG